MRILLWFLFLAMSASVLSVLTNAVGRFVVGSPWHLRLSDASTGLAMVITIFLYGFVLARVRSQSGHD